MKSTKVTTLMITLFITIFISACSTNPSTAVQARKALYNKQGQPQGVTPTVHTRKALYNGQYISEGRIQPKTSNIAKIITAGALVYIISEINNGYEIVNVLGDLFLKNKAIEKKK